MSASAIPPNFVGASPADRPPLGGLDIHSCGECRHFDSSLEQRGPHGLMGFCLRYPPTLHGIRPGESVAELPVRVLLARTSHPVVSDVQDACGEFAGVPQ